MSLKTCKAKVRSGYIPFSSFFSIYPDTASMLLDPANIKVQFIIFMVTGGGDWWLVNCSIINGWWALFLFSLEWNKQQAEDLLRAFCLTDWWIAQFSHFAFRNSKFCSSLCRKKEKKMSVIGEAILTASVEMKYQTNITNLWDEIKVFDDIQQVFYCLFSNVKK